MLCQICGKNPASVHFTEIHDNKMSEIHVCERCAEEKGMQASAAQHKFEIADLLATMVDAMTQTVAFEQLPETFAALLKGAARGRTVVKIFGDE